MRLRARQQRIRIKGEQISFIAPEGMRSSGSRGLGMNNAAPVRAESTLIPFAALFMPTRASPGKASLPSQEGRNRLPLGTVTRGSPSLL